jgi:glycosyltransferase involved in cell wall biosynthesis
MRRTRIWHRIGIMKAAGRLKTDVVLMPSPGRLYFKRRKLVVTIHDLIPLLFSGDYDPSGWREMQRAYLWSMHNADLVLTDSECSKADMVGRFGVPYDRVRVVHLGFDSLLFKPERAGVRPQQQLQRYGIDRPYLLHVGRWQPRKNIDRLIRAYHLLNERRRDLCFQLVLCGPRYPELDKLDELVRELAAGDTIILTGAVPDEDLALLYRQASGFAMPSLYEGFGLPPLEAMASGIPVMSSNRSSLPEILGEAAIYFDPESIEEIASAMERLISDTVLQSQLVERGLAHVKQFSWEKCARKTFAAVSTL